MKCVDNKQYSKSKVQKKNTKQEQNEHLSLQKVEIGSVAMDELLSRFVMQILKMLIIKRLLNKFVFHVLQRRR